MTELLLIRHGETDWNAARRFQGHADPPLNDRGRAQARALADELAVDGIDAIYTSDLRRASETAEIIASRLGLGVATRPELREIDVGEWQGLTWEEIDARYPDGRTRWSERGHGWEHGETYEELADRVVGALHAIAVDHPGGRVLVVGHGGTIRSVRARVEGRSVGDSRRAGAPIDNCGLYRVRLDGGFRAGD